MSVLEATRVRVDPPDSFPVQYLSCSSLDLFESCAWQWKRKYIDHERVRPSGKMLLGGAAGAALHQHYGYILERGEGLSTEAVLDEYATEWDARIGREEVEWGEDAPGSLKDSGAGALAVYHRVLAPEIVPVSVEREFELSWPGAPFTFTGFLDLETQDGAIGDFKVSGSRWSQDKAAAQLQPTVYLAARRAEGNPASGFAYHTMIRTKQPKAEIVPTERSDHQLDLLTNRVFSLARAIQWRWLNDCWQGVPAKLAWMCRGCSYAAECPWTLA